MSHLRSGSAPGSFAKIPAYYQHPPREIAPAADVHIAPRHEAARNIKYSNNFNHREHAVYNTQAYNKYHHNPYQVRYGVQQHVYPSNYYIERPLKRASAQLCELEQDVSHPRIRKPDLISISMLTADYAALFIETTFECPAGPFGNSPVTLENFIMNIMTRTRINTATLIIAFLYLERLKRMHPKCRGSQGSSFRLLMSAIILASKYSYGTGS
jgi:hypothetical protein